MTAPASTTASSTPGRSCPLHYRYAPAALGGDAAPDLQGLDTLYVAGGLYGNPLALAQVLRLFELEGGRKRLVFNGDFHWFDRDPTLFRGLQATVLSHRALRGNVETELADLEADDAAGCGCAYPDWVGDAVVQRSNDILRLIKHNTRAEPALASALAALPMHLRADVGTTRISIVHGDAQSLAGWGFAQEHLQDQHHRREVANWFDQAGVSVFACTHTCLPVIQSLQDGRSASSDGQRWVVNNGATGMPNFESDPRGLLTRISLSPAPGAVQEAVCAERMTTMGPDTLRLQLVGVSFDQAEWKRLFRSQWPAGSPAHESYWSRITQGPSYHPHRVVRTPS